jgi:hypothetical protein
MQDFLQQENGILGLMASPPANRLATGFFRSGI